MRLLQLHAAVVELSAGENAEIKYSTVQNWYAGNEEGVGGIYNFVTKRGLCHGARSKISWTQVCTCAGLRVFGANSRVTGVRLAQQGLWCGPNMQTLRDRRRC